MTRKERIANRLSKTVVVADVTGVRLHIRRTIKTRHPKSKIGAIPKKQLLSDGSVAVHHSNGKVSLSVPMP